MLNFCDHQELDRQVPLMDEMDEKVGSPIAMDSSSAIVQYPAMLSLFISYLYGVLMNVGR